MKRINWTTNILWAVYICLLAVLVPHTAWMFEKLEMPGTRITNWAAAIAFEAAIAVLTHKLAKHIEDTAKIKGRWAKFSARYLNPIGFGLYLATAVSALANLAHAVEFGQTLKIFTQWGVPQGLYSVAFGGVLPVVSLIFANVLSNVVESEELPNPEVERLNTELGEIRRKLRESDQARRVAEDRARTAEERFGAAGDIFRKLLGEDKRERILAVRDWRPQLSGQAIAVITEASPAYVSEVLKETTSV